MLERLWYCMPERTLHKSLLTATKENTMANPRQKPAQSSKTGRTPKSSEPMNHRFAVAIKENVDRILQELSLEESKPGRMAREALRARRDGEKERAETIVKPLFMAVAESIIRPEANPEREPDSGNVMKPVKLPPEWRENETDAAKVNERMTRMAAYRKEGARLKNFKKFAQLDEDLDLMCISALADLLSYGGHCAESLDDSANWVGAFVADILREVAARGPESVNARPEDVKYFFDRSIENLRDTMALCRHLGSKIPSSALEEIEKWGIAPSRPDAAA